MQQVKSNARDYFMYNVRSMRVLMRS